LINRRFSSLPENQNYVFRVGIDGYDNDPRAHIDVSKVRTVVHVLN
jgi:hypothetical protein